MEIRGRRECSECGTEWSYYDTGEVACPSCGSMRSVGVDDDRALHTTTPASFDLTEARVAWEESNRDDAVELVKSTCRSFVRGNGFVHAGDLIEFDGRRVAARELTNAVDIAGREVEASDAQTYYVLELLREADEGTRPDPADVPASMRSARGLAVADTIERYRRDVRDWLEATGRETVPAVTDVLSGLETHQKRVQALQGDVDPVDADALYTAARELNVYLRADDGEATRTESEDLEGSPADAVVRAAERLRTLG